MLALVFDKKPALKKVPRPRLKRGEALVRVRLAGVCNTDVEIVRGYMGYTGILGHEFTGVVEKVAEGGDASWVGRRVVGEINAACGKCDWCARGLERHCPTRTVVGIAGRQGCFAEYVTLPAKNLHAVPDKVTDEQAVFTEPLAAGFEIIEQVKIRKTDRVAVIGDGKLGALAAAVLATKTPHVIVLGRHEDKLKLIRDTFGVRAELAGDCDEGGFDVTVECSGAPGGLDLATGLTRARGTLVLKSTYHDAPVLNTAPWVINEITIVGSRCGPFAPALRALRSKRIDPRPLIHRVFPAQQAVEAMAFAQKRGVMKVLLDYRKL